MFAGVSYVCMIACIYARYRLYTFIYIHTHIHSQPLPHTHSIDTLPTSPHMPTMHSTSGRVSSFICRMNSIAGTSRATFNTLAAWVWVDEGEMETPLAGGGDGQACRTSWIVCHTSHVTRHTSHVTRQHSPAVKLICARPKPMPASVCANSPLPS